MQAQELSLDLINLYGGTQARVQTTDEAVESYAEEMTQGTVFPPIDVYFDGATYWLADGFHRYLATKRNQLGGSKWENNPYFNDPLFWGAPPFDYGFPGEWGYPGFLFGPF